MIYNHKHIIIILYIWLSFLAGLFAYVGGFKSNKFLRFGFGPSPDLEFLSLKIDSWDSWIILNLVSTIDTCVNTLATEIISPWIYNTLYNDQATIVEYPPNICVAMSNGYYLYHSLRGIMDLYISFTQIDILLFRILSENIISFFTASKYAMKKIYKPINQEIETALEIC